MQAPKDVILKIVLEAIKHPEKQYLIATNYNVPIELINKWIDQFIKIGSKYFESEYINNLFENEESKNSLEVINKEKTTSNSLINKKSKDISSTQNEIEKLLKLQKKYFDRINIVKYEFINGLFSEEEMINLTSKIELNLNHINSQLNELLFNEHQELLYYKFKAYKDEFDQLISNRIDKLSTLNAESVISDEEFTIKCLLLKKLTIPEYSVKIKFSTFSGYEIYLGKIIDVNGIKGKVVEIITSEFIKIKTEDEILKLKTSTLINGDFDSSNQDIGNNTFRSIEGIDEDNFLLRNNEFSLANKYQLGSEIEDGIIFYLDYKTKTILIYKEDYYDIKNPGLSNKYFLKTYNSLFSLLTFDWQLPSFGELILFKKYFKNTNNPLSGKYWSNETANEKVKCIYMNSEYNDGVYVSRISTNKAIFIKRINF
tara:strand:+ start:122 stop:1405 length:1284 start_codon:yes stop_codon:yes gene_type:complete